MIKVIEDYYIEVSPNPTNYAVYKGTGKVGNRGQNKDLLLGYAGSMDNALEMIRKHIIAYRLSRAASDLPQAIHTIREVTAEFSATIHEAGL